ncbi:MAG: CotH kinase family protein, partial [Chitinispirillia bacterium]
MKFKTIISILLCFFYVISIKCTNPVFDYEDDEDYYADYHIPDIDSHDLDNVKDGIGLIKITLDSSELTYLLKNSFKQGSEWKRRCTVSVTIGTDTFTRICDLKIHGGISRGYHKKSFRLYFKDQSIFSDEIFKNFPNRHNLSNKFSELVLNANCMDLSNIRNYLSMYISSRLGAVTPRIGFTRLVINGKYFGLYSVIERVNQNMVKKLLKHSNFDLLKSCSHDGNLKTVNDFNNKRKHDPTKGFELKHGNWKLLKEFEFWLESDKYSYEVLSSRLPKSALLGFNLGYFYCGVSDSYSKNYYI